MTFYSDAYAATGWDAPTTDFINFETTFSIPALTAPLRVPDGSVVTRAADSYETADGWRDVTLTQLGDPYGYTLFDDLDSYVTAVHGSWDGEDAEISLKTATVDGTYVYYNCIAHKPRLGTDFTFNPSDSRYINDLKLRYTIVTEYTPA